MKNFRRILIANRGEIAARIARTIRKMGLEPILVYSDADFETLGIREASESYRLGPGPAGESYLNSKKILDLALQVGAEAIHPGYGFLSENSEFAREVQAAGLVWIGPSPEAMDQISSKSRAKELADKSGVPTLPGFRGEQKISRFVEEAEKLGYPLLLKATAGGGGRGIRKVENRAELEAQFSQAATEAQNAFGDPELILEKYISKSRHIEIQIFGDSFGDVVHLGERDCSVQRRHQKLIEESPSPAVNSQLREEMTAAAVRLGKACGYSNAGTVEFLLTPDGKYYFLEVNARLQVEHPVTELVTRLDLVEWQIRIASGEKLPLNQSEIQFQGHSIQARLYAEDSYQGYRPQTGRIEGFHFPSTILVDHFLTDGTEITPFYDSMLAKIISVGHSREQARQALIAGLEHSLIAGLTTNQSFLLQILKSDFFKSGQAFTQTLDNQKFSQPLATERAHALKFATLAKYLKTKNPDRGWSNNLLHSSLVAWRENSQLVLMKVEENEDGIRIDGTKLSGESDLSDVEVLFRSQGVDVLLNGTVYSFVDALNSLSSAVKVQDPDAVSAPMAGTLTKVMTTVSASVKKGDVLAIVEAMKMQLELRAPRDGKIETLNAVPGTQVKNKQILMRLSPMKD